MRKIVNSFLPSKDIENIFKKGTIVFDTNILLGFYFLKVEHISEIFNKFAKINYRLWLPYHTINEFMKQREKVIIKEIDKLIERKKSLKEYINSGKTRRNFEDNRSNANSILLTEYIGTDNKSTVESMFNEMKDIEDRYIELLSKMEREISRIFDELKNEKERFENDDILDDLIKLYENKIGRKYSHDELKDVSKEAIEKSYYTLLPGLSEVDTNKTTNTYGDYINYFSIIDYSKEKNADIIYITNDSKEDWGYKVNGQFRYNPTIYEDFYTRTNNKLLIIKFEEFINTIDEYIKDLPELSEDTKEALKQVSSNKYVNLLKEYKIDFSDIKLSDFKKNILDYNKTFLNDIELFNKYKLDISNIKPMDYKIDIQDYNKAFLENIKFINDVKLSSIAEDYNNANYEGNEDKDENGRDDSWKNNDDER